MKGFIKFIARKSKENWAFYRLYRLLDSAGVLSSVKGKFLVQDSNGKSYYLFNQPFNLESEIYWQGIDNIDWEKTTRKIWTMLCERSHLILDIGANSGIFSVMAKAYNPTSIVYAFEPQPNIFSVLAKNNQINNFDLICNNIALSNMEGKFPFYNYGKNTFTRDNTTAGSLNKEWRKGRQQSILVDVKTLDTYIKENSVPRIDLIKIDVETLEYEVLQGYMNFLHVHRPIIILEVLNVQVGRRIESLFSGHNYLYYHINENEGAVLVSSLGSGLNGNNYIICPIEKRPSKWPIDDY